MCSPLPYVVRIASLLRENASLPRLLADPTLGIITTEKKLVLDETILPRRGLRNAIIKHCTKSIISFVYVGCPTSLASVIKSRPLKSVENLHLFLPLEYQDKERAYNSDDDCISVLNPVFPNATSFHLQVPAVYSVNEMWSTVHRLVRPFLAGHQSIKDIHIDFFGPYRDKPWSVDRVDTGGYFCLYEACDTLLRVHLTGPWGRFQILCVENLVDGRPNEIMRIRQFFVVTF